MTYRLDYDPEFGTMESHVFVSPPGRCETHDAGLDDLRGNGKRQPEILLTRAIYSHGAAGENTYSGPCGELRERCRISKWESHPQTQAAGWLFKLPLRQLLG